MISESNKKIIISNHNEYIKSREDAQNKIYSLKIESSLSTKFWKNLYGNADSSIKHMIAETYLREYVSLFDKNYLKKKLYNKIAQSNLSLPIELLKQAELSRVRILIWMLSRYIYFFLKCVYIMANVLKVAIKKTPQQKIDLLFFSSHIFKSDKDKKQDTPINFILKQKEFSEKNLITTTNTYIYRLNKKSRFLFCLKSLGFIFVSIIESFKNRSVSNIIIGPLIKALYIQYVEKDSLPEVVFLEIHSGFHLPAELLAMKKRGVKIIMFEFSQSYIWPQMNDDTLIRYSFYSKKEDSYENCLWNNKQLPTEIWCFDNISKKLILDFIGNKRDIIINTKGIINMNDSSEMLPSFSNDNFTIGIFGNHYTSDRSKLYANNDNVDAFMIDTLGTIKNKKLNAYVKTSKKKFNKINNNFIQYKSKNVIFVSELLVSNLKNDRGALVSAKKIIDKSDLIICFPFTTPGFEAQYNNKNVFFYDPFSVVGKNTCLSRDIPIIRGKEELLKTINFYLSSSSI